MASTPVLFDYGTSPYSRKVHDFCAASNIKILSCSQSPVLPRPTLQNLGITYRRIPILAIGKDVFADTSLIIDVLQNNYGSLPTDPAAKAFQAFGDSLFQIALSVFPPGKLDPKFVKDREPVFPILLRPDHASLRPSALAEFRAALDVVEREFLGRGTPFINGDRISGSDLQVGWAVRWIWYGLVSDEPGFEMERFPAVRAWIDRFPEDKAEKISDEDAVKSILNGDYIVKESKVDAQDPLGISIGQNVMVENTDAQPGACQQRGELVSSKLDTVTIELQNGARIHFPRKGTLVKKASE